MTSAVRSISGQTTLPPPSPLLLDVLRHAATERGHSAETIREFVDWTTRFILFNSKRHPRELTNAEIGRFLRHVAQSHSDALRAIAAARMALDFLYREVLHLYRGELPWARPPRLLDQVRQVLRVKHYSPRTEECYVQWIRRYILFHDKRHPRDLGAAEIEQFLTHLAVPGHVSASTQNQALSALLFLYCQVLEIEVGRLDAVRARRGSGCLWSFRQKKSSASSALLREPREYLA